MRKRAKRLFGGVALVAVGGFGVAALLKRKGAARVVGDKLRERRSTSNRWARPGMQVSFRAELMLGRERAARTFRIAELLPSGRVRLENFAGEHTESEFEPQR